MGAAPYRDLYWRSASRGTGLGVDRLVNLVVAVLRRRALHPIVGTRDGVLGVMNEPVHGSHPEYEPDHESLQHRAPSIPTCGGIVNRTCRPVKADSLTWPLVVCAPGPSFAQAFGVGSTLRRPLPERAQQLVAHRRRHLVANGPCPAPRLGVQKSLDLVPAGAGGE